jgi:hypothetical protein
MKQREITKPKESYNLTLTLFLHGLDVVGDISILDLQNKLTLNNRDQAVLHSSSDPHLISQFILHIIIDEKTFSTLAVVLEILLSPVHGHVFH